MKGLQVAGLNLGAPSILQEQQVLTLEEMFVEEIAAMAEREPFVTIFMLTLVTSLVMLKLHRLNQRLQRRAAD